MLLYGASSPADAWIDNGEGTATHIVTGLMWMRSAIGQAWVGENSIGVPKRYWGTQAEIIVHHFAGYDDWRVPTINELMSIIYFEGGDDCIDKRIFPNHEDQSYLSRSGFEVNFKFAHVKKSSIGSLRLVRSVSSALSLKEKAKFNDNGDGTATDVSTGLTWMRCTLGQTWDGAKGIGEPYSLTREDAMLFRHTFAGFDDWRMPSIGELNSIVDREKIPCADMDIFTDMVVGRYLSSTLSNRWSDSYCINFENGEITFNSKSAAFVRLVRGEYQPSSSVSEKSHITFGGNETKHHQLSIYKSGSGSGDVSGCQEDGLFEHGRIVTITAHSAEGSVFDGWLGDVVGHNITLSFTVDSTKIITAQFSKLKIPNLDVKVDFDGVKSESMRSGDEAFILTFSIANAGAKKIRVECPLTTYTTRLGEEIEQEAWLSGLFSGTKGASIRAGAFRKMGLVFFRSKLKEVLAGDILNVSASQTKPERRFNFTFRCTDQKKCFFTLINAAAENTQLIEEIIAISPEMAVGLIQRIEILEAGLSEALRRLDALQAAPPAQTAALAEISTSANAPAQTLLDILAWIATQDRVSVAVLRSHLLPLDLLPSAFIDELNERALDLTGEIALEEFGDEITIVKKVLFAVIANLE